MERILSVLFVLMLFCASVSAQSVTESPDASGMQTVVFTDDLGREVVLPAGISRIAPSGSNAQVMIFQIAPEKLVGLSTALAEAEKTVYPAYTHDLPVFGTLYGKRANLNRETLILADPQLIIDVGDIKGSIEDMAKELDDVSKEVGVPVIFIEANMGSYPSVFRRLGNLLGYEERGEQLARYCEQALKEMETYRTSEKPTVYITSSSDGLYAIIGGKSHAECAEIAGAEVVATSRLVRSNGNISLETLYQLDPKYIFALTRDGFRTITEAQEWSVLDAVRNGRVYLVPSMPHGFIDQPVCTNRIIGLYWLASIFYPQAGIDIAEKTREFYRLFYRCDLSDGEVQAILNP